MFLLPFYSSKIADLWRLNYCKILYTNIYWNKLYLKIWWIYSTRNLICYLSIWNKLWNLIRTEKPGPPSVIPQLFLQCESKRKCVTLPLPLTYLNKATALLHKNSMQPGIYIRDSKNISKERVSINCYTIMKNFFQYI